MWVQQLIADDSSNTSAAAVASGFAHATFPDARLALGESLVQKVRTNTQ